MTIIGIDVSKDALDIYDLASGSAWRLPNHSQGHAELLAKITEAKLVVLEATGGYESDVQAYLSEAGLNVAKVNPRQVRNFAKATGRLAKTDKLDAQVLALFGAHGLAQVRAVPSMEQKELKAFVNRRSQLADAVAREKTRAKQAKHPRLKGRHCSRPKAT
jgi:transposase